MCLTRDLQLPKAKEKNQGNIPCNNWAEKVVSRGL